MNTGSPRQNELAAFLQTRRAQTSPEQVGLTSSGPLRRVKGLRREEVAQLAMISTDYYTRLEQGRLAGASTGVLGAIAEALRLGPTEKCYLFQLANKDAGNPSPCLPERVRPETQVLLDNLVDSPAIVVGRRCMDLLAWNAMAAALFTDFGQIPIHERNWIRLLFLEPNVRGRHVHWHDVARRSVAFFRMATLDAADDTTLTDLVTDLSVSDPHFRTWWASHIVDHPTIGTESLTHPLAGELTLDWQLLRPAHDEQQIVIVWTAPTASRTREALRRLRPDAALTTTYPSGAGGG